ncbi:type V CRISPR-associated protein Cas4 [Candidatus Uhrbacteria bacterium CG_4_10_14_0_2_um_filter_41_7]|uniref:Type V CRISPR-associated protein Cas4 n=1 Tax=Candidatus Uhrbacteria bacterium CG_4_9_14_3_um_filter_41_35 TaxID=1975034 RepID=A0A2M7XDM9_9BACT|nr:MAG: type V CRISPR-associated protein Cas4 [Candidatus Uhrbacteria bacterium CG11_big_fil_rev_8_21_14_0_20_41_9]PIZ53799.1 MAG: type V CRISPR-associated protein Cas4 [Candidatus Uhrbacteria bacterium CG_4_10_14_0_2_um_filter_41_7]PJA45990.1 MAG: type V CRISPR-associated protein Cas4 [Candidatus Uhrbacteria bacterium CG_4_9_14_3_um_filter_41_35]
MYYDYIQISKINDYLFCPWSIYFHSVYENFEECLYKAKPQIGGTIAHKTIESKTYSTEAGFLQSLEVFSEKYGLIGKIDLYNQKTQTLTERKNKIQQIYDGQIFQLYAQKLCLEEMGYTVKKKEIYSMTDNKKYPIIISEAQKFKFTQVLEAIKNFDFSELKTTNLLKCDNCIYRTLCKK